MASVAFRQYLDSFINYEVKPAVNPDLLFRPQRLKAVLAELGRPQESFISLHVAGTKGKGSTCAFIAEILKQAGYRTGLYTSPHFHCLNERIRVLDRRAAGQADGIFSDAVSDGQLDGLLHRVRPVLEKYRATDDYGRLTYFEALTVLAFCFFAQQKVRFGVLETGMGGRLDATNVVDPLAGALTSISLDHTDQLGGDLAAVAREKAAIIKAGKPAVIAPQSGAVLEIIAQRCQAVQARAVYVGRDIPFREVRRDLEGQEIEVVTPRQTYAFQCRLLGGHQAVNAATAVALAEIVDRAGFFVSPSAISAGIAETFWPGRFELMQTGPDIIIDAAHNPDSVRVLLANMRDYFSGRKILLVLGISRDKDVIGICREFAGVVQRVFLTRARHPRAYDFSDPRVVSMFAGRAGPKVLDVRQGLLSALQQAQKEDVILVTGSIFAAAEARQVLVSGEENAGLKN